VAEAYHPATWLLWLLAGGSAALLTRNPLYLLTALIAVGFLFAALLRRQRGHDPGAAAHARPRAWLPILKLALILWLFTTLFNAFTVHLGDRVLLRLPAAWPLVGGPITLEALMFGFVTGLSFVLLILIFAAFNSAVSPHTLLRLTPAFAYHVAVIVAIAISFIPQTLIAWQELNEAQRLRGQQRRGLADWRPLFISLLAVGLDRAIQLAESMDARGFGGAIAGQTPRQRLHMGLTLAASLLLLLIGLLLRAFAAAPVWAGSASLGAGALLLALVLRRQGQRVRRSNYRRWLWRRRDSVAAAAAGLLLTLLLLLTWLAPRSLFYYPYPPYPLLPDFEPLLGIAFALLITPALLAPPGVKE